MDKPESNFTRYRRRAIVSALALAGVGGLIWSMGRISDYPPWFLAVLLGLVAINFLNWVLEPVPKPPRAPCKQCGRRRLVSLKTPCACGETGLHMPWLNRFAFAMIVLFLAVIGISFLWSALGSGEMESRINGIWLGVLMIILAAAVMAEANGLRFTRGLRRALGSRFPYDFEEDVKRVRWHAYLAVRVIVLILTVALFTGAVAFLLRHP